MPTGQKKTNPMMKILLLPFLAFLLANAPDPHQILEDYLAKNSIATKYYREIQACEDKEELEEEILEAIGDILDRNGIISGKEKWDIINDAYLKAQKLADQRKIERLERQLKLLAQQLCDSLDNPDDRAIVRQNYPGVCLVGPETKE